MSLGSSGDDRVAAIPQPTCELLRIESGELEVLMEAIVAEFNQVSAYVLTALRTEGARPPGEDGPADVSSENQVKKAAESADHKGGK